MKGREYRLLWIAAGLAVVGWAIRVASEVLAIWFSWWPWEGVSAGNVVFAIGLLLAAVWLFNKARA